MVKGDAAYDVAKEKCDDLSGNAKDVCIKDAKVAHTQAKNEAKMSKVSTTSSSTATNQVADVKKDAMADERQALYKAANERCDALTGAAKDGCQNTAKTKYGMK